MAKILVIREEEWNRIRRYAYDDPKHVPGGFQGLCNSTVRHAWPVRGLHFFGVQVGKFAILLVWRRHGILEKP